MTDASADDGGRPDPAEPGRTWVFGDNIDTDRITPSRFTVSSDPDELVTHVFEDLRPEFSESVEPGDFVVAGENFGNGSLREHSPPSLVGVDVSAVITQSFVRIFFRNAINLGLSVLICPDADVIEDDDEIHVDLDAGVVTNHTRDETYEAETLPEFLRPLIGQGGLKAYTKAELDGWAGIRPTLYGFHAPEALDAPSSR